MGGWLRGIARPLGDNSAHVVEIGAEMLGFAGYFSEVGGLIRDILRNTFNVPSHFRDDGSAVAHESAPISVNDCQLSGDAGCLLENGSGILDRLPRFPLHVAPIVDFDGYYSLQSRRVVFEGGLFSDAVASIFNDRRVFPNEVAPDFLIRMPMNVPRFGCLSSPPAETSTGRLQSPDWHTGSESQLTDTLLAFWEGGCQSKTAPIQYFILRWLFFAAE